MVQGLYTVFDGMATTWLRPNLGAIVTHVREGTLDFVLLKPIDSQFWLSLRTLSPAGLPEIGLGLALLIWGSLQAGVVLSLPALLTVLVMVLAGGVILYSLWFLIAATSIWFVKTWNATEVLRAVLAAGAISTQCLSSHAAVAVHVCVASGLSHHGSGGAVAGSCSQHRCCCWVWLSPVASSFRRGRSGCLLCVTTPLPRVEMPDWSHWLDLVLPFLRSPLGAVVFIPVYALWVTLLLPGIWASMLAGVLYGTWWGSLIVFIGACLGAEAAFLIGRHWLRDWTSARLERFPKLQAIEKGVSREGLKLVMLTRLSPAFPFSLLNLAYGLSDVSLRDYTIGLVAILPGTVLFCALGALAGDAARFGEVLAGETSPGAWVLRIVGVLATLAVVWLAGRAARKALADQEADL
jgi:uncharacterized membrane protein YdjX (TVP38/TMEM64 family)